MNITLDGNIYQIKSGIPIRRSPLVNFPDNIRLDGQQKRKDRSLLSSWAIDRWSKGLGLEQINVDVSTHDYRFWDAENVDTRWESHICLSPKFEVCTISDGEAACDYLTAGDGNIWFFKTNTPTYGALAYKFAGPNTFGSYKNFTSTDHSSKVRSVEWHNGKFHSIIWREDDNYFEWATVNDINSGRSLVGTFASSVNIGTGPLSTKFAHMGATYHAQMTVGSQSVKLFLGKSLAMEEVDDLDVRVGSYLSPLVTDNVTVFLDVSTGIYSFGSGASLLVDTRTSADQNPAQVLFETEHYFKNKNSLVKYDGTNVYGTAGYDKEDGLTAEKFGEITYMTSNWRYIFAAVKGATYSHILTRDSANQWQYYARVPSAGRWVQRMFLSDYPDAINRLWCELDDRAVGYYLNPLVNPIQAATYSYVPTGHFRPCIHNGGMPEEPGAYYDMVVTADEVGDEDQNTITVLYGMDGSTPCATLGVVATSTDTLIYGSPYGIEGYRTQPEFWLSRASGASGTTPLFRSAVIHYLKLPRQRQMFDLAIDTIQTADKVRDTETILSELDAIREKKVLVPFSYGEVGTRAVKVLDLPTDETQNEQYWLELERTGVARIKIAEIR